MRLRPNLQFDMRLRIFLCTFVMFCGVEVRADKIEVAAGGFQLSASNSNNSSSAAVSGPGAYHIAYRRPFFQRYEIDFGYSILISQIFTGDMAFGVDIGLNYFPLTTASDITASAGDSSLVFQYQWRPFVGAAFSQRNFQSTNSQYVGFGVKAGAEYQLSGAMSVVGSGRFISLGGPNKSEATQIDLLGGIALSF